MEWLRKSNIQSNKVLKKNNFKSSKLISESSNVASYFAKERLLLDDIRQHMLKPWMYFFPSCAEKNVTMQLKSYQSFLIGKRKSLRCGLRIFLSSCSQLLIEFNLFTQWYLKFMCLKTRAHFLRTQPNKSTTTKRKLGTQFPEFDTFLACYS